MHESSTPGGLYTKRLARDPGKLSVFSPIPVCLLLLMAGWGLSGCVGLGIGYAEGFDEGAVRALNREMGNAGSAVDLAAPFPSFTVQVLIETSPVLSETLMGGQGDINGNVVGDTGWLKLGMHYTYGDIDGEGAALQTIGSEIGLDWRWFGVAMGWEWATLELPHTELSGDGLTAALALQWPPRGACVREPWLPWRLFAEVRWRNLSFERLDGQHHAVMVGVRNNAGLVYGVRDVFTALGRGDLP